MDYVALCCSAASVRGLNSAGWVENNAPCSWNPGKGRLYPRAQPSQASLKLLDLLSILLILKENKLHK